MTERTLSTTGVRFGSLRKRSRLLGLGSLTGLVAGMASFMYVKSHLVPWGLDPVWALVLVGVAGAYTHFLATDLNDSIGLSLVAVGVGLGFHTIAWIAPLWILPYSPFARDLILPQMLGDALQSAILVLFMTFYGSYFGALLIDGYLKP